jgi:predicted ATP-dependent serine protease
MKNKYCSCGREKDKYSTYCSECGYYNRRLSLEIGQEKYLMKNRDEHNKRSLQYYHDNKKLRSYYKNLAKH